MSVNDLFKETVFLLGAGASMDAGCYSSKQMLQDLHQELKKPSNFHHDLELQKNYQDIYNFILSTLSYQQVIKAQNPISNLEINIEDFVLVLRQIIDREFIIPAPLVGSWSNKIESWEIRKQGIFVHFLNFVTKMLIDKWTSFNPTKSRNLVKPYSDLLSHPDIHGIDIFTLNYDLIFEANFNSSTEHLMETGFTQGVWKSSFDEGSAKIKLYKLHGSLNWYFDTVTETVKYNENEEYVETPLIIFGSSYKMQSYDPFITLLSKFKEKLFNSSLYVIVGYSFSDKYINNIIIQSLSEENKLAIIVDPYVDEDKTKFISKVELIQNSPSTSELINLTRINPNRIKLIKKSALDFYKEYLSNNAKKLDDILNDMKQKDMPFG